jgi:hypothetical protein
LPVEVWAVYPIWHPNIDLRTGKVALPLEWSPVLTLKSIALAVQMLMLEPSTDNPLNLDAFSVANTNKPTQFEEQAQNSLFGGWIAGVLFQRCVMSWSEMSCMDYIKLSTKRPRDGEDSSRKRSRVGSDEMDEHDDVCSTIAQTSLHDTDSTMHRLVDANVPMSIDTSHTIYANATEGMKHSPTPSIAQVYAQLSLSTRSIPMHHATPQEMGTEIQSTCILPTRPR